MIAGQETRYVRLNWNDPGTGQEITRILPLPLSIGRAPGNTLVLNSDRVSRQHAQITVEQGAVIITDRNSGNGTSVNRQRITQTTLKEGDSIEIGPFLLSIEFGPTIQQQAAAQVRPPSPDQLLPPQIVIRLTDVNTGQTGEIVAITPVTIGRQARNTVVLPVKAASRRHAMLSLEQNQIILTDQGSGNGTLLNGQKIQRAPVGPTDTIQIANYRMAVAFTQGRAINVGPGGLPFLSQISGVAVAPAASENEATLVFQNDAAALVPFAPAAPPAAPSALQADVFPPASFKHPFVTIAELRQSNLPVTETTYLSIGGGLGSFAWVDHLLIWGVAPDQIVSLGLEPAPYARYKRLCGYSQIPLHERLRSNSESCPDNIWGWPSYGIREIWHSLGKGQFGNAFKVGKEIFCEPVLTQTYTPRAGDVFHSIDREARRIGWDRIWRNGRAKAIRKTDDGRYVIAYTQANARPEYRNQLIIARYVHLAVGYPGVQFLADLQEYRERTKDFQRVVNAYEDHETIYQHLLQYGGTVMVRGRGIVASRIIQRLYEVRARNPQVRILHLLRSPVTTGHRDGRARRPVKNHWDFQPFNWPKACWGGTMLKALEKADDQQRDRLINDWGGTTTADRKDWQRIINTGLREGWYQIGFGNVKRVERNQYGQLSTIIQSGNPAQPETWLIADFIIDCTGLEAHLDSNAFLKDMADHHQLPRNPKGRLKVTNDFEVIGMNNGYGKLYATGAMTLGGPFAAVDSFLGLQYAALRSVDSLAAARAPGVRRLNSWRSFTQWLRWARGVHP